MSTQQQERRGLLFFLPVLSGLGVFSILAMLLVAMCGCSENTASADCNWSYYPPTYRVVNNTNEAVSVDHFYRIQGRITCPSEDDKYPQSVSIPPGGIHYGRLIDPYYGRHRWKDDINLAPTTLIAIRPNKNTIAYYTGYSKALSNELNSWLIANQSSLNPSFYNPMPTADSMDVYSLFFVMKNPKRARPGFPLPPTNPDRYIIRTGLDSNHSYAINTEGYMDFPNFSMTFTVNGPKKSDIVISCEGSSSVFTISADTAFCQAPAVGRSR